MLARLKAEKLRIDNWREKEIAKAEVKTFIRRDFLYSEDIGLPAGWYSADDVEKKSEVVFNHILVNYSGAVHNAYVQ